jgi:hypothetical protein
LRASQRQSPVQRMGAALSLMTQTNSKRQGLLPQRGNGKVSSPTTRSSRPVAPIKEMFQHLDSVDEGTSS